MCVLILWKDTFVKWFILELDYIQNRLYSDYLLVMPEIFSIPFTWPCGRYLQASLCFICSAYITRYVAAIYLLRIILLHHWANSTFFYFFTQIVWLTWSKHTFCIKRVNRLVEFYFLLFISGVTVRITISTVLVFCIFYTSVNWLMKRIELLNIVCH